MGLGWGGRGGRKGDRARCGTKEGGREEGGMGEESWRKEDWKGDGARGG